jgi:peptidyl-tRNA hydrolase
VTCSSSSTIFRFPGTFRFRTEGSSEDTTASEHRNRLAVAAVRAVAHRCRTDIPEGTGEWADYVLAPFEPQELEAVTALMPQMIETVEKWLKS